MPRLAPAQLPRLAEIGIDGRVLLFTPAVAILVSLLFGAPRRWIPSKPSARDKAASR